MGFFNFFGTTCSGWLADRYDNRRAAVHLFRSARAVAALPAVLVCRLLHHDIVRDVLWSRLVRHPGAHDQAPHQRGRAREGRHGLRLGVHVPSARRRICRFFCRSVPRKLRRLHEAFMLSGLLCLFAAVAALFIGARPGARGRPLPPRPRFCSHPGTRDVSRLLNRSRHARLHLHHLRDTIRAKREAASRLPDLRGRTPVRDAGRPVLDHARRSSSA